ncbi:MAG TPA: hypothetical protein VFO72_08810 [Pyrinomonadaceae bacterium]|nr:hypothetical protein [Pyrinomonadaceae bacterium]
MEAVSGVFESRQDAQNAINELRRIGIADNRIGLVTPGTDGDELEAGLPVTDTERPGMGKAMGAAVGGAMGAAGGATLGLAVATLAVPGIGPLLAFGMVGAALLGVVGATAGSAVGDQVEEELGEGIPHEDIFVYEDALRHGRSVLVVYADNDDQADKAEDVLDRHGAIDLDELRQHWWNELRDTEREYYHRNGRDFDQDEESYRRGFQAALHPKRRGRAYTEVEQDLRTAYGSELDTAFREGYERGLAHQSRFSEAQQ